MQIKKVLRERGLGLRDPPARWGHTGIVGKSGYGKGTTGQMLGEKYYDKRDEKGRRYKVLIWTMFRSENTTMGYAEDNPDMLNILYSKGEKPRGYKTEVLIPVFQRGTLGKVQIHVPEVWKPVKINYHDLTRKELLFLVGDTSEKAEQILDALPLDEFESLGQLQKKIIELSSGEDALIVSTSDGGQPADIGHKTIYGTISRAVGSLLKKNIVVTDLPKGFEFIDLEKMQKQNDQITVIAGNCCWSKENFMTVFINVMSRLIHYRHLHSGEMARMAIYVPEISNFDDPITKKLLTFILQEARDAGMDIILDSLPYDEELVFKQKNFISYKKIGEIVDKKLKGEVLSFSTERKEVNWKTITNWIKHPNSHDLYEVETIGQRKIKCTGTHSIFKLTKEGIEEAIVEDLKKGDKIVVPKKIPTLNCNRFNTGAYWLFGFWVAEGYIDKGFQAKGNSRRNSIEVSNTNLTYIKKFQILLKKNFGITSAIYKRKYDNPKWNDCYKLIFANKELATFFRKNQMGVLSSERKVPNFVFSASAEAIKQFLIGFWDGEGQKKKKFFQVDSTSEELIDGVGFLLTCLGENWNKGFSIDKRGFKPCFMAYSRTAVNDLGKGESRNNEAEFIPSILFEEFFKKNDLKCEGIMSWKRFDRISFKRIKEFSNRLEHIMVAKKKRHDFGLDLLNRSKKLFDLGLSYTEIGHILNRHRSAISRWVNHKTIPTELRQNFDSNWKENWFEILSFLDSEICFLEVKGKKKLKDEKFVYDISVKDNENFLTRDLIFAHNTQIPKNIPGSAKEQITRWYVFNLSPDARDYFHHNLKELPYEYGIFDSIPNLEQGVCVLLYQGDDYKWRFRKPTMITPPKSHKKVGYESVNDYFSNRGVGVGVVEDIPNKEITVGFASDVGLKKVKRKGVNTFIEDENVTPNSLKQKLLARR